MKLLLVIDIDGDVAEAYEDFTVDYDLRGTPKDDQKVNESIKYVEDCPLKPMPEKIDILEQSEKDFDAYPDGYLADKLVESQGYKRHGCCTDVYLGWNACVDELDDDELDFSGFGGDWG